MQVHYDFSALPSFRNAVVTIGTFDGVHLGHRALLQRIVEIAERVKGESVLLSFYPHPRMVLYPEDHRVSLLSSPDEKVAELETTGINHLVIIPFSLELSRLSAFDYVRDFLVKGVNAHTVVVGHDHRFGRNREGDFTALLELSDVFGFHVEEIPAIEVDELEVSSTKVRSALERGDVDEAAVFLGRPYALCGEVVTNRKLGRTLGFPTANLRIHFEHKLVPTNGVYVSRTHTPFGIFNSVTNIGRRPSVGVADEVHIETHIFDFDKDLYDKNINVELLHYLRPERKFESLEELRNAIQEDCSSARLWVEK